MKNYKDKFGNAAKIEPVKIYPYKGAETKIKGFRLWVYSEYDKNFVYFVSVYESFAEAENKLKELSCGTFKEG